MKDASETVEHTHVVERDLKDLVNKRMKHKISCFGSSSLSHPQFSVVHHSAYEKHLPGCSPLLLGKVVPAVALKEPMAGQWKSHVRPNP